MAIFRAEVVTFGEIDHGVEHAAWSIDATGEAGHFIIERGSDQSGESDWGYCLISNGMTHYGGIQTAVVGVGTTTITLTDEAAEALGIDSEIEFRYPAEVVDGVGLQAQLSRPLEARS